MVSDIVAGAAFLNGRASRNGSKGQEDTLPDDICAAFLMKESPENAVWARK